MLPLDTVPLTLFTRITICSHRFIDLRDKRIALQGKQKIVGVLTRLSSEEIYVEIAHNIDRFTRSAKLFQSLVKVLQEAFRRVMLSIIATPQTTFACLGN